MPAVKIGPKHQITIPKEEMKVAFTPPFRKDYQGLPARIQEQIDAQIMRLLENPRHPSLRDIFRALQIR